MRTRELNFNNHPALIVYLTEDEKNNPQCKSKIESFKAKYKYISFFVSGKEDIKLILKRIIANKYKA